MNQRKPPSLTDYLHKDAILSIFQFVDADSFPSLFAIKKFNPAFSSPNFWENILERDFGMTRSYSKKFPEKVKKDIYLRLALLEKNSPKELTWIKQNFFDTKLDMPALTATSLPEITDMDTRKKYLDMALSLNNMTLFHWLSSPERGEKAVSISKETWEKVVTIGNYQKFLWLLNRFKNADGYSGYFHLQAFDKNTLSKALVNFVKGFIRIGKPKDALSILNNENIMDLQSLEPVQIAEIADLALVCGEKSILEFFIKHNMLSEYQPDCTRFYWSGNPEFSQWLLVDPSGPNFQIAASESNYQLALNGAAYGGNVINLEHVSKKFNIKANMVTIRNAIESENHTAFMWAFENVNDNMPEINLDTMKDFMRFAAQYNSIEIVQYLYEKIKTLSAENNFSLEEKTDLLMNAASSGNIKLVEWIVDQFNILPNEHTLNSAVEYGRIALVQRMTAANDDDPLKVIPTSEYLEGLNDSSWSDPDIIDLVRNALVAHEHKLEAKRNDRI